MLAHTTSLYKPREDDYIVALFQKLKDKARFKVEIHHFSLHAVDSSFDTGTGPNLADQSIFRSPWKKHIRPAVKLGLKLASNQPIHI